MKLESYDTGANSLKAYQEKLLIYVESQVLAAFFKIGHPIPHESETILRAVLDIKVFPSYLIKDF